MNSPTRIQISPQVSVEYIVVCREHGMMTYAAVMAIFKCLNCDAAIARKAVIALVTEQHRTDPEEDPVSVVINARPRK